MSRALHSRQQCKRRAADDKLATWNEGLSLKDRQRHRLLQAHVPGPSGENSAKVTPSRGFHNSRNLLAVARIILVTGQEFHPTTSPREQ